MVSVSLDSLEHRIFVENTVTPVVLHKFRVDVDSYWCRKKIYHQLEDVCFQDNDRKNSDQRLSSNRLSRRIY